MSSQNINRSSIIITTSGQTWQAEKYEQGSYCSQIFSELILYGPQVHRSHWQGMSVASRRFLYLFRRNPSDDLFPKVQRNFSSSSPNFYSFCFSPRRLPWCNIIAIVFELKIFPLPLMWKINNKKYILQGILQIGYFITLG